MLPHQWNLKSHYCSYFYFFTNNPKLEVYLEYYFFYLIELRKSIGFRPKSLLNFYFQFEYSLVVFFSSFFAYIHLELRLLVKI
jgi:hypothetical protein